MGNAIHAEEILDFVDLDEDARAALAGLQPVFRESLGASLDAFYRKVMATSATARFFPSGPLIDSAKDRQKRHWEMIASGDFGEDYLAGVRKIGETHARLGLEPRWYIAGYAVVLNGLIQAAVEAHHRQGSDPQSSALAISSLVRAAMIDMDFAISIYLENLDARRAEAERVQRELEARQMALVTAKVEADAANLAKSAFLANMSHEIRTPLNGVLGVADLLSATNLSSYQAELVEIVRESAAQLNGLLGDVLDLARIESGEFSLAAEPFSLASAVQSVAQLASLKAADKGLALNCEIEDNANRVVIGDVVRLKQVLTNLLSNAVKFTTAGSVRLHVSYDGRRHRFLVADTGIGFDPSQREEIFSRFRQADETTTRKFGGSGLGLAISRDLVNAMGGSIDCSAAPGAGATFWFDVPLQLAGGECPRETEPTISPRSDGVNVLVVDDNPTNRRVVELILGAVGATTTCVENGEEALNAFAEQEFDVVLMDKMMPVMDGVAAVRAIRAQEVQQRRPRTPIIMLTASTLPEQVRECLDAGAQLHLAKPITADALIRGISEVVDRQDAAHALSA